MKNTIIESKKEENISYIGKVKVSVLHNNKIISSKEYYNNGLPNIFKFLCNALAGNYLDNVRPVQVKLFNWAGASAVSPEDFSWSRAWSNDANIRYTVENTSNIKTPIDKPEAVSPYMVYDVAPVVKRVINEDAAANSNLEEDYHYETTFHFRFPGIVLSGSQACIAGFYTTNTIDYSKASAYYLFKDNNGWAPLEFPETGDFSIIIEWTLSISNK